MYVIIWLVVGAFYLSVVALGCWLIFQALLIIYYKAELARLKLEATKRSYEQR